MLRPRSDRVVRVTPKLGHGRDEGEKQPVPGEK